MGWEDEPKKSHINNCAGFIYKLAVRYQRRALETQNGRHLVKTQISHDSDVTHASFRNAVTLAVCGHFTLHANTTSIYKNCSSSQRCTFG
jgi:hypothetical protein